MANAFVALLFLATIALFVAGIVLEQRDANAVRLAVHGKSRPRYSRRQLRQRSEARNGYAVCTLAALGFAVLLAAGAYADSIVAAAL